MQIINQDKFKLPTSGDFYNTLNDYGTISANSSKVINLDAQGDYSSFQGSLFVRFTADGYESSTLDEQVQV